MRPELLAPRGNLVYINEARKDKKGIVFEGLDLIGRKQGGAYLVAERRPLPNFDAVLSADEFWACGAAGEWLSPFALAPLRCVLLREASSGRGPLRREEAGVRFAVDPRPEDWALASPEPWRPALPWPLPGPLFGPLFGREPPGRPLRRGRSCADWRFEFRAGADVATPSAYIVAMRSEWKR